MRKQRTRNERRAAFIDRVLRIMACLVVCILVAGTLVTVSEKEQTDTALTELAETWEK